MTDKIYFREQRLLFVVLKRMSDKISAFSSWFFIETACTFIANITLNDSKEYINTTSNTFPAVAPELIKL